MALTGVHIVCARVAVRLTAALPIYPDWSETLASAGTTANAALVEESLVQVSAGVDAYFTVGKTPDASQAVGAGQSARYFVQAGTTRDVYCTKGDKVAWVPA